MNKDKKGMRMRLLIHTIYHMGYATFTSTKACYVLRGRSIALDDLNSSQQ